MKSKALDNLRNKNNKNWYKTQKFLLRYLELRRQLTALSSLGVDKYFSRLLYKSFYEDVDNIVFYGDEQEITWVKQSVRSVLKAYKRIPYSSRHVAELIK